MHENWDNVTKEYSQRVIRYHQISPGHACEHRSYIGTCREPVWPSWWVFRCNRLLRRVVEVGPVVRKRQKAGCRKSLSFKTRVPDVLSKRAFMRGERECKSFAFVCPTEMHSAKGIAFCAMFAGVDDKAGKTKNRAKITGPKRGRI